MQRKKSSCRSALLHSNTKHPIPSRRTPDPLRRPPGSSAGWCCSRPRRGRCRPTAEVRLALWRAAERHRADRRHQPRSPGRCSRVVRGAHRCAVVRHRRVPDGWSAPAAGRRARRGIRRSPAPTSPARRSPDTLRWSAVPAASSSAGRFAEPAGARTPRPHAVRSGLRRGDAVTPA